MTRTPTGSAAGIQREVLPEYRDDLLGIPVVLKNAVVTEYDAELEETTTEVPDMDGLVAAVAMARCLTPVKLCGYEIRFLRKALELTQAEFAEGMEVSKETVSRWESDGQTMAGYSEKLLRHWVCSELSQQAPAVDYDPSMINHMKIKPVSEDTERPPLVFERVFLKSERTRTKHEEWDMVDKAA